MEIVRNGSRGMAWLEPMLEVETGEGRIAYGPVTPEDVPGLVSAGLMQGGPHKLRLGRPEEMDYLLRQQRLTFARAGITDPVSLSDYEAPPWTRSRRLACAAGAAQASRPASSGTP